MIRNISTQPFPELHCGALRIFTVSTVFVFHLLIFPLCGSDHLVTCRNKGLYLIVMFGGGHKRILLWYIISLSYIISLDVCAYVSARPLPLSHGARSWWLTLLDSWSSFWIVQRARRRRPKMPSLNWLGHLQVHQQQLRSWAVSTTSAWSLTSEKDLTMFQLWPQSAPRERTESN